MTPPARAGGPAEKCVDSCEFHDPAHDLCRAVANLAGEEHVAAGRYATVLRHKEHFAPSVSALSAGLRALPLPT